MKQRQKKSKVYSTESLFVYKTSNQTFAIEGNLNGKRVRQRAKTLDEAKSKCHALEEGKRDANVVRTSLSDQQMKEAERVFDILPDGVRLEKVIEFYLNNYRKAETTICDAMWKYLETKEGRSRKTYEQIKGILKRFALWADGRYLQEVTQIDACQFLNSVPQGSYNHFLRITKGLYRWAERQQLVNENPFIHIQPRTRQHTDVGLLTCDEAEKLLEAAQNMEDGELLAYTAITLFAGLRPDSEMKRLTWDLINLEDSEIRVINGKTRTPRTVEMPVNLLQWLLICDRTKSIYPKNFRGKWAKIRIAAGFKGGNAKSKKQKSAERDLKPWVKDVTRHSAISYRVRKTGDINTTATWAGNSPSIIRTNYLGLVSGSDAKAYFSINPSEKTSESTVEAAPESLFYGH